MALPWMATDIATPLLVWLSNSSEWGCLGQTSCTKKFHFLPPGACHPAKSGAVVISKSSTRDGRIVIFCRIPDSVNWRVISGRFQIIDVTLPLVYTYKSYSKSRPMLYFSVTFSPQWLHCAYIILSFDREITSNFTSEILCHYKRREYATVELRKRSQM